MAFNDNKSAGDIILSQDWDDFVDFAELISSNSYGHSSNTNIHLTTTQKTDLTDGGETSLHIHDSRYYTETELNGGQLDTLYYTESEVDAISGAIVEHIKINYQPSGTTQYLDDFYPSSFGAGLSGSYSTHRQDSSIHFTKSSLDDDYAGSSNVNWTKITAISSGFDGRLDTLEAQDEFDQTLYIISANAIYRFYPSSIGAGVSSNLKLIKLWYDASSGKLTDAYKERGSQIAGDGLTWDGSEIDLDHLGFEDLSDPGGDRILYWDEAFGADGSLKWGTTGTGIDLTGSAGSKSISVESDYTDSKDWYLASAQKLSEFASSGDKYSKAYASAQIAVYDSTTGGITGWYNLGVGTGITPFGGSVSISGTQDETLTVLGYTTISTQAQKAYASAQIALYESTAGGISNWRDFNAADNSIAGFTGTYSVSGTGALSISVPGYLNISGNAHDAKTWYDASAQKLSDISGSLASKIKENLADLDDISDMTNKSGGDVLTWDTSQSKWSSQASQAGGISNWQTFTAADSSIAGMTGTYAISGDVALSISVPGYLNISGNAFDGAQFSANASALFPGSSNVNKIYLDTVSSNAEAGAWFSANSNLFDQTLYITSANALSIFTASSVVNKTYIDEVSSNAAAGAWFSANSNQFDSELYITSSNLLGKFYPSALGRALMDFSSNASNLYEPKGASGTSWSGALAYVGFSSNTKVLYHPSGYVVSGGEYSQAYASAQLLREPAFATWGRTSTAVASGSHNHPLSGLADVIGNFDSHAYHDSGLKWNEAAGTWQVTKVAGGGGAVDNFTVKIDAGATADYIGNASNDGVIQTDTTMTYIDGGNFVTLGVNESGILTTVSSNARQAYEFSSASDIFDHELYIASSVALSTFADSSAIIIKIDSKLDSIAGSGAFYPSSLGAALMAFSSNASNLYEPKGASGTSWSGALSYVSFSSNTKSLYHPSGYVISGAEYSQAYASAQVALYSPVIQSQLASGSQYWKAYMSAQIAQYETELGSISFNAPTYASGLITVGTGKVSGSLKLTLRDIPQDVIKSGANWQKAYMSAQLASYSDTGDSLGIVNWNTPTATSGAMVQGGGMVSGTLSIFIEDYIASSSVIANTVASSTALGKFYPSTLGKSLMDFSSNASNLYDNLGDITWGTPTRASGVILVGTSAVSGALKVTLRDIPQNVIKSGANWQKAYMSAQLASYSDTGDSLGVVNWQTPTASSGLIATGVGKTSGSIAFYIEDYIASASAIAKFPGSSNIIGRYHPSSYGTFPYISTQAISGVHTHDVRIDYYGDTIFDDVCMYNSMMDASVLTSGGIITRTAACTGAIDISRGIVYVKEDTHDTAEGWVSEIDASSNIYLDEGINYIYVDYNSGSPKYAHKTTSGFNKNSQFPIGQVYNDTTTGTMSQLHIFQGGYRFPALGQKVQQRFGEVYGLERSTGLVAASSQQSGHPLCLSVTDGIFWKGLNKFTMPSIDTGHYHDITAVNQSERWFAITGSKDPHLAMGYFIEVEDSTGNDGIYQVSSAIEPSSAGYTRIGVWQAIPDATIDGHIHDETFTYWYRDGAGGWIAKSGQTDVDPNYYDDGTGTLNTVGNSKYGIHWLFLESDGDLNILYGQGGYNLAEAEDATTPSSTPDLITNNASLIARLIIEQGETDLSNAEFSVPWVIKFTAGSVDQHNDLGGIQGGTAGEYYHLTSTDDTNFNTLTGTGDASTLHHHDGRYYTETESDAISGAIVDHVRYNYYPSSLGKSLMDFSSNASNLYEPKGASGTSWSGALAYVGFSSNTKSLYHPSGFVISGNEYSQAYASTQALKEHAFHTIISGQYIDDYIASSETIGRFFPSTLGSTLISFSSNAKNLYDNLGDVTWGAPTQASGVVLVGTSAVSGSLKVTLRDIPQDVIKSGANWQKAYMSAQLLKDPAFSDFGTSAGDVAEGNHTHTQYDNLGEISWTTPTAGDGISLDGTTGMTSGSLTIKVDDDSVTQGMLKSGSEYWKAYLSAQVASYTDTGGDDLGTIDWQVPTASSGLKITNLGKTSGSLALYIEDYIASTSAIAKFAGSSSINTKIDGKLDSNAASGAFYPSSLGKGVSSQVLINTLHSANSDIHFTQASITTVGTIDTGIWNGTDIDPYYVISGEKTLISGVMFSKAYASAQIASYESSGFDATQYITSSNALSLFADSSTTQSKFILTSSYNASGAFYPSSLGKSLMSYSSNARSLYAGTGAASKWRLGAGGIYYSGEISLGHSGFDIGDYKLQVSGASFFSGSVTFLGEISGVAIPTYDSGASSKKYVDNISGAIVSHVLFNYYPSTLGIGVSSNVKILSDWYNASSNEYSRAFASANALRALAFKDSVDISDDTNLSAGEGITLTGDTISWASGTQLHGAWASTQALQDLAFKASIDIGDDTNLSGGDGITLTGDVISWASGSELHSAYLSAQSLKEHSFHTLISGSYLQSGLKYSKAYRSAQIALYTSAGDSLGIINWNTPTATSGVNIQGGGMVSGTLAIFLEDYIASSSVVSNFANSGILLGKYYPSTLGKKALASAQSAMFQIQDGITNWDSTEFLNSGIMWDGTNWEAMPSGGSDGNGGQWSSRTGGIYYENEVTVGHSDFDLGNYKLQVSGASYFSGSVDFIGEISGISDPTYASGVSNKHYVDTISGAIVDHVLFNYYPSDLGLANNLHSSNADLHFPSSNLLEWLGNHYAPTGTSFDATSYITSSNSIDRFHPSGFVISGGEYSQAYASAQVAVYSPVTQSQLASGTSYWKAYLSAQVASYDAGSGDSLGSISWNTPTAASGIIVQGGGMLSGNLAIFMEDYIASTNAVANFAHSTNINGRFYGSGSTINSNYIMSSAKFTVAADTDNDGYLTSTDWDTFNNKSDTAGVPGTTISSNFFLVGSGNTLWGWYSASGEKLSTMSGSINTKINSKLDSMAGSGSFYPSSLGAGVSSQHKIVYDWFAGSSSKYSGWYTSGAKFALAYDHSQDNTQAHSDYLLNSGDDSSDGVITAFGFVGALSSQKISSAALKMGVEVTNILDEDEMDSDSDTALATQQSIKAYVLNNATGVPGATISSNFFLIGSGNTLWSWYDDSSQSISTHITNVDGVNGLVKGDGAGNYSAVTDNSSDWEAAHDWYNASSSKISQNIDSGTKYTSTYNWFSDSSSKISNIVASGHEYTKAYQSAQIAIYEAGSGDSLGSIDWNTPTATSGLSIQSTGMVSGSLAIFIDDYISSSNAVSNFTGSSNVNRNYIDNVSSNAQAAYNWTNSVSGQILAYPSSLGKSLYDFSSNVQAGTVTYNAVSSAAISGAWTAPIYRTNKPAAAVAYEGQIIVASGGTDKKSWVFICLHNDANGYEWVQLGLST